MTLIAVKVVPRAAKNEIVGWLEGALKIRIQAPPEDGRANRALEELLAEALGLKKNAVTVATGRRASASRSSASRATRSCVVSVADERVALPNNGAAILPPRSVVVRPRC